MCKAAEITQNEMTLMREDEDKTVIKKRDAQGSESKRLQNLKNARSKAETSAAWKTREEASAVSKQCAGHQEKELSCWEQPQFRPLSLQVSPRYPDSRAEVHKPPTWSDVGLEVCGCH